jgi:branched-chain amino acid transport system permease protein
MKHQHINKIMLAGLLVIAFALPLVIRSATYLHILVLLFFYAYLTTSWNIVGGVARGRPRGPAPLGGLGAGT